MLCWRVFQTHRLQIARPWLFVLTIAATAIFLLPPGVQTAPSGPATGQVQASVNRVLRVVKEHPASETQQLEDIIGSRFDFDEMARRSLGSSWRRLTPSQQREFVAVFKGLLRKTYLDEIKAYSNQKVLFTGEKRDGNYATVESRIVPENGEPISLNYRVQLAGDQWKVYDVIIENVSLVNNYRAQFSRVLVNGSYEELIRRMKEKEQQNAAAGN